MNDIKNFYFDKYILSKMEDGNKKSSLAEEDGIEEADITVDTEAPNDNLVIGEFVPAANNTEDAPLIAEDNEDRNRIFKKSSFGMETGWPRLLQANQDFVSIVSKKILKNNKFDFSKKDEIKKEILKMVEENFDKTIKIIQDQDERIKNWKVPSIEDIKNCFVIVDNSIGEKCYDEDEENPSHAKVRKSVYPCRKNANYSFSLQDYYKLYYYIPSDNEDETGIDTIGSTIFSTFFTMIQNKNISLIEIEKTIHTMIFTDIILNCSGVISRDFEKKICASLKEKYNYNVMVTNKNDSSCYEEYLFRDNISKCFMDALNACDYKQEEMPID